jgi:phage terminase small subunit
MKQTATAPAHLRPDTQAWWQHVHANWRLEQHDTRLLTMAAEAWDRACQAREILAEDGSFLAGMACLAACILASPLRGMQGSLLPG